MSKHKVKWIDSKGNVTDNPHLTALFILVIKLGTAQISSNAKFYSLIEESMWTLRLNVKDIAHLFDMSIPAVKRWQAKRNAPLPAIRYLIYQTLKNIADCRMQSYCYQYNILPRVSPSTNG